MELTVNHQNRSFIPLQSFRAQWNLPETFGVAYFEPKQWEGLGSIEGAGPALVEVRRQVLQAVPTQIPLPALEAVTQQLKDFFHRELAAANTRVGLRDVEIDFAVSGFYDVLSSAASQLLKLALQHRCNMAQVRQEFSFANAYQDWMNAWVKVSSPAHSYRHGDLQFSVRIITNPYGRVGMAVEIAGETYYVLDMSLACPAASYMQELCGQVAKRLCQSLTC